MVEGMTQEIYDKVSPYLTTLRDAGRSTSTRRRPESSRSLPGMTDQILVDHPERAARGSGSPPSRRSCPGPGPPPAVAAAARGGAVDWRADNCQPAARSAHPRLDGQHEEVLLTLIARTGPQALPVELRALIQPRRNSAPTSGGNNGDVPQGRTSRCRVGIALSATGCARRQLGVVAPGGAGCRSLFNPGDNGTWPDLAAALRDIALSTGGGGYRSRSCRR